MRIVYDDTKQTDFVNLVKDFIWYIGADLSQYVAYDWGTDRIQRNLVLTAFDDFLYFNSKFERGKSVTHAYGIGNNCLYPVYYKAENELQQCASINFNIDGFGCLYISVEDYNGKRVSNGYIITKHGITKNKE